MLMVQAIKGAQYSVKEQSATRMKTRKEDGWLD